MSDVHNTPAAAPVEHAVEPAIAAPGTQNIPAVAESTPAAAPAVNDTDAVVKPEETAAAPLEGKAEETPAVAPLEETKEAKVVEPVSEGHLGYKAPGLLKQFTFSKKEFWLTDSPVTPQHLDMYLRGEKSEVSHPVVAWASQSGKGLLFFNKKSEIDRTHPAGVLALYDATDLKKSSPHEFSFELHGHKHQFKAANDAERDGWYLSLEKAIELGKASKESVRAGEGYKSEMEKLNTPNLIGGATVASKARGQSQPKKSTDIAEPRRTGSSEGEDEELKKKTKSRSTSRGVLNRLKGKKDEVETKHEIKKEEKEEAKEEKKIEKEEIKAEKEAEKTGEVAPGTASTGALGTSAPLDASSTADRAVGAPVAESKLEEPVEALPTPATAETKVEEKPKASKRGSIFGKLPGAWNSMKSPTKEKDMKDAELKPEVPPKDTSVSESAPQLPETTTAEPIEPAAPATTITDATKPEISEPLAAEAPKSADVITPSKEKKNFLSGLGFLNKRDRSVSPSAIKETPTKTETPAVLPVQEEAAPLEPVKAEEPAVETPVAAAAPIDSAEKSVDPIEEPKATDATTPGAKRQSMFGNLSRRASKALNRIQTPKKENVTPTTESKADEVVPSTATSDKVPETSTTAPVAEENKPEAVGVSSHTPVVASA